MKLTTPFTIVGRCLTPALSPEDKAELADTLRRHKVSWEMLLATANMHRCTPLWYVRLRDHGLLDLVPTDLRDYLAALHSANTDRNRRIRAELVQIVQWFNEANIPVLLLKGAATFADDLYKDLGARLMCDLDLLVPEADVFRAKCLLLARGYSEDLKDLLEVKNGRILSRGHHLTPLECSGSPVKIELHYRMLNGFGGRALTAEHFWATAAEATISCCPVLLPAPTERVLHNVFHATLQGKGFIQSHIRLSDLAEFAAIVNNCQGQIDEQRFWVHAGRRKFKTEAVVLTGLARAVLKAEFTGPFTLLKAFHIARILNCSHPAHVNGAGEKWALLSLTWRAFQRAYYYFALPRLVWRVTHASEQARIMGLFPFFVSSLKDKRRWRSILFDG